MTQVTAHSRIRALVECSLMIALGTILARLKLFELPNGGAITVLSMLPFVLVSFRWGTKWGLLTGLANSILQILLDGLHPTPAGTLSAFLFMLLLDYFLGFSVLGLARCFAKPFSRHPLLGVGIGTACVCMLRFCCVFVSGFLIWGSVVTDGMGAVLYSLQYNLSYMLPETIFTTLALCILAKMLPQTVHLQTDVFL